MNPKANQRSAPRDKKYYRFGLSGLTSGGKTCLLAALALPRIAHPRGLTADLNSHDLPEHLADGCDWVTEACNALRLGERPPPNPHTEGLTIRYKFTDGKSREFFVELEDYSGELLDRRLSKEDLAKNLKKYLAEVDGFLFIAEHPMPGQTPADLAGYLQELNQALAHIREGQRNGDDVPAVPIALLVNKWDRHGPLANTEDGYELEEAKLAAFFSTEPPPPHRGMLDSLNAAAKGDCRAFPVSAFGEAVREPDPSGAGFLERPARVEPELPSFGILEPFVWLVEQCDRRTAKALDEKSRRWWHWLNPVSAGRCHKRTHAELVRMSKASPEHGVLRAVCRRMTIRYPAQVGLLVLLGLGGEFAYDSVGLRQARAEMTNPAAPGGRTAAEQWFDGYISAGPWRHFVHRRFALSNEKASSELAAHRNRLDDKAWRAVEECVDPFARMEQARKYIERFPQGRRCEEADRMIAEHEAEQKRSELKQALAQIEAKTKELASEYQSTVKSPRPDLEPFENKIKALRGDLDSLPHHDAADEDAEKRIGAVLARLGEIGNDMADRIPIEKHRREYYSYANSDDWFKAGRFLAGLKGDYPDLKEHFANAAPPGIEHRAKQIVGNGAKWQEGLDYIVPFRDKIIQKLMPEDWNARVSRIEMEMRTKGDQYLYGQCNGDKPGPFRDYLEKAPLGAMRKVAQEWIDYFDLSDNPNTYRVGFDRIEWGKEVHKVDFLPGNENEIHISVGNAKKVSKMIDNRKGVYVPNDREKFAPVIHNLLARDVRGVTAQIWDKDTPDPDDNLGKVSFQAPIEELQGRVERLTGCEFGESTIRFWVEVRDRNGRWKELRRPPLPPWSPAK